MSLGAVAACGGPHRNSTVCFGRCVLALPGLSPVPQAAPTAKEPRPPATDGATKAAAAKGAKGSAPAKRGVRMAEAEAEEEAGVSAAFEDSAFFAGAASFELPEARA